MLIVIRQALGLLMTGLHWALELDAAMCLNDQGDRDLRGALLPHGVKPNHVRVQHHRLTSFSVSRRKHRRVPLLQRRCCRSPTT